MLVIVAPHEPTFPIWPHDGPGHQGQQMEDNARWYLAATNEVDQGNINAATWAKAIAMEQGDSQRARYTYIQLRVQQFAQAAANGPPPARGLTASSPPRNPLQPGRPPHNGASHGDRAQSMSALAPRPADVMATFENPDRIRQITRQFNWGAALLPFLWCLFNTRGWYWAAAVAGNVLIPGLGWLVTGIVFGLFGSRWSWASKDWDSFEAFQRSQTGWTVGGIVFTVTVFVLLAMAGG